MAFRSLRVLFLLQLLLTKLDLSAKIWNLHPCLGLPSHNLHCELPIKPMSLSDGIPEREDRPEPASRAVFTEAPGLGD